MSTLPNHVARCNGHIATWSTGFGTASAGKVDCVRCLRRTEARQAPIMEPPTFVSGKCPMRIGAEAPQAEPAPKEAP